MSLSKPLLTFRDTLRKICPPWLQHGFAERLLYPIGAHLDILGDALVAGIKLRFPNEYSAESLPWLGRERRIRRGINESDEIYGNRMRRWLDDHARRGGPYAMLAQLYAHYAAAPFEIELVNFNGGRYTLATDGTITHDVIVWAPDTDADHWARWWLLYHWPTPVTDDGVWEDPGTWGDGGAWGTGLSLAEVEDLRTIPAEWNSAHTQGTIVLIGPGGELWGSPGVWGDPGVWGGGETTQFSVG